MSRPSKLTDADRSEIHRRWKLHLDNSSKRIAKDYGITVQYVSMLITGTRGPKNAHTTVGRTTQESDLKYLGKGL